MRHGPSQYMHLLGHTHYELNTKTILRPHQTSLRLKVDLTERVDSCGRLDHLELREGQT
jgi:hypothetical protein